MEFPKGFIIDTTLKVGVVYKIVAPELLNNNIQPHYFIVVAILNDENHFAVCTTQIDKRIEFCKKRNIDLSTITYIEPNEYNGLTKDSYIDCNQFHRIHKSKLYEKIESGKLTLSGNISEIEYNKIIEATSLSKLNDFSLHLLKYQN